MVTDVRSVKVKLWGTTIGYLYKHDNGVIGFQYDNKFISSGINVSPIKMPLSNTTYYFPTLSEETFKCLPGMVADSLPDKFGNIVIKKYLENMGRTNESLTSLEKLCYIGQRGMGALEYEPAKNIVNDDKEINIDELTKLAREILSNKENIHAKYDNTMISQLMECSSSVGGARAKTLIAWNQKTNDIRSGQIKAGKGYEYWLLKFDDISNNKDKDSTPDNPEYTRIEYAYHLMSKAAGIKMSECRLYTENGRAHFITKRFDRIGSNGAKLHMQSLCALAHMDFNLPRTYSYEDAFNVMRQMHLPYSDFLQLYKRMVFNELAKNYDDHTKNIAFLMNKKGEWSLAPAYDVTFSYNKDSVWVNSHQMLINNKADNIVKEDLLKVAEVAGIKKIDAQNSIEEVRKAVSMWKVYAEEAGLSFENIERINKYL